MIELSGYAMLNMQRVAYSPAPCLRRFDFFWWENITRLILNSLMPIQVPYDLISEKQIDVFLLSFSLGFLFSTSLIDCLQSASIQV